MFLAQCPSREAIARFVRDSQELPLSYSPVGIAAGESAGRFDETLVAIGRGRADFERAREALLRWRQFDIGWVDTFPQDAPMTVGTVVAVLVRHLGFWSLNGCRVVYRVGSVENDTLVRGVHWRKRVRSHQSPPAESRSAGADAANRYSLDHCADAMSDALNRWVRRGEPVSPVRRMFSPPQARVASTSDPSIR